MIVFIGGQPRSGSTFSFNIARETLMQTGTVASASSNSLAEYGDEIVSNDNFILKSHALEDAELQMVRESGAKLIITKRPPVSAIASAMDTFGIDRQAALDGYLDWRCMLDRIEDHALVIDHTLIEDRPGRAAAEIAGFLAPAINPVTIAHICKRHTKLAVLEMSSRLSTTDDEIVDVGFSFYDRETLYHRSHVGTLVSREPEERVSAADLAWIREALDTARPSVDNERTGAA